MHAWMKSSYVKIGIIALILCFSFTSACKQAAPETKKKKSSSDGNPDLSTGGSDECASLSLVEELNWQDDIAKIVAKDCTTCHGASAKTVIVSYSDVKNKSKEILDSIQGPNQDMPMGYDLEDDEVEKFATWLKGEMKEMPDEEADDKDENEEDEEDEEEENKISGSDSSSEGSINCETGTTSNGDNKDSGEEGDIDDEKDDEDDEDGEDEEDWRKSLDTDEYKACKKSGKIFDRAKEQCNKASIAESFECTWTGVIAVFAKHDIGNEIEAAKNAGYELDQCGEYKNEPIIYMLKEVKNDANEDVLRRRKACFKGSEAC